MSQSAGNPKWKRHYSSGSQSSQQSQSQTFNKNYKPSANPIIEQWLMEWREEAVQKNSKMQFVYSKALNSLRKYPLPLSCGKECKLLENFGDTLAKMIDMRIAKEGVYLPGAPGPTPLVMDSPSSSPKAKKKKATKTKSAASAAAGSSQSGPVLLDLTNSGSENEEPVPVVASPKKKKGGRQYIPSYRSGAYALLVTLGRKEGLSGYRGYMLKSELISEAQEHSDSSFTRAEVIGSNYTAWNSMGTLINKNLVVKQGNPAKYMLTDEGREKAALLLKAGNNCRKGQGASMSQSSAESQEEMETDISTSWSLQPGTFDVILYVDIGETTAKHKDQELLAELQSHGINYEVRKLSVGDFVWVCRSRQQRSRELVVPFVVERKRGDDLAGSIKDGRFHEQKLRLSQTGLKVIYLIEGLEYMKGNCGLGEGSLERAIANTQVVSGFMIQETSSIKDTCLYLAHMTGNITKIYQNRHLWSCMKEEWPVKQNAIDKSYLLYFTDFNEHAVKQRNWTIKEMFAKHLLRMRGLSVEKAFAIVEKYPSPQALLRGYSQMATDKEKELMLASMYFGNAGKTIGPAISRAVYKLYKSPILS